MTLSNFFRFPMVFLCGVFSPVATLALPHRLVASVLPLTYTVDALRHLLLGGTGTHFSLAVDLSISALFAVMLYLAALSLMYRRLEDLI